MIASPFRSGERISKLFHPSAHRGPDRAVGEKWRAVSRLHPLDVRIRRNYRRRICRPGVRRIVDDGASWRRVVSALECWLPGRGLRALDRVDNSADGVLDLAAEVGNFRNRQVRPIFEIVGLPGEVLAVTLTSGPSPFPSRSGRDGLRVEVGAGGPGSMDVDLVSGADATSSGVDSMTGSIGAVAGAGGEQRRPPVAAWTTGRVATTKRSRQAVPR